MLNTWLRRLILAGLFLTPFVAILVYHNMFFPFITGKNFAFRIIVEVMAALWLFLAIRDPQYRPRQSLILWALGLFIGIMALADFFGVNPYRSFWSDFERMEGLIAHLHFGVYFLVLISVLKTEELWRRFFHTSFAVSFFLALFGVLQLYHVFDINQGGVRVDATLGNAAYFAIYLLFSIFLTGLYALRSGEKGAMNLIAGTVAGTHAILFAYAVYLTGLFNLQGIPARRTDPSDAMFLWFFISGIIHVALWVFLKKKQSILAQLLYAELLLFQVYVLYYTATRGAILGALGGIFLAAIVVALAKPGRARSVTLSIAGILLIGAGLFFMARDTSFVQTSPVLKRFSSFNETTVISRFKYIWPISLKGFQERPLLGWGQDNYNVVFNKYYDPHLWAQEQWFDRAHNVLLDWLIAGGVLGILSYLALFGSAMYVMLHPRRSDFSLYDRAVLFGLLMGYFAQNLTVFDNLTSYILFFSVLAYIHVRGEGSELKKVEASDRWRFSEPVQWGAAGIVGVGFVLVFFGANVRPILASSNLIKAISPRQGGAAENLSYFKKVFESDTFANAEAREQLMIFAGQVLATPQVPEALRQEIGLFAYQQMLKQIAAAPNDARYEYFEGAFLRRLGPDASKEAEAHLMKAVELSPQKQGLIIELGTLYLGTKDYPKALLQMKKAFDLDPAFDEARRIYALTAIYANDYKLAESLLVPQYGSIAIDDDRFVTAFVGRGDFANAIKIWQDRVAKNPKDARQHVGLGVVYLESKQISKAIAAFKAAVAIDPALKQQIEDQTKLRI